jgi:hypothetical protein
MMITLDTPFGYVAKLVLVYEVWLVVELDFLEVLKDLLTVP